MADGAFAFSVVALNEAQAVERARQFINSIGPSWKLWDSEYIDPTVYAPDDEEPTAQHITTVDAMEDVFNDPEHAVEMWEQEFKELVG